MDDAEKVVHFTTFGNPVPQGSTRAFVKAGKAVVTQHSARKLKDWRGAIAAVAQDVQREQLFYDEKGVYAVKAVFYLRRPKSLPKKVRRHYKRPDLDKLVRALLDALTGVLIPDDSHVFQVEAEKRYAEADQPPGVEVWIGKYER
ncbi:MAG: RusA family crossover junction endodeoxyribonuclease [Dehalococcoidales bacterium]|nr:RusA family crossover junction endodeoxyribonuclease [Dehalococcoidales bacterium]